MKIPLRIKETLYHDSETGKPVGSEYWVFDDAAEELFVINDDEDAARRIVAAVNACEGIDTESLETIQTINIGNYFNLKRKTVAELDRLRQKNAELLEALKGVCDNMGWDDDTLDHIEYVRAARAAIAEAEQHEPAEPTSEQILEFMGQAAPFVPREKIWMLPPTLTPSEMKGALPPLNPRHTIRKILFLDTETVGIPADPTQPYTNHQNWPEMVSIAWQLQSESGEYITAGDYIVAPRPGVENGATHINGITPEMQETYGTEIRVILKKLLEAFADADLVVAHNVQFDQPVIFAELDRLGYEIPWKEWYCTKAQSVDLCRIPNPSSRYAGKWKWPSLDELHQFLFNEPIKGRDEFHGAAVDMWACARCYYEMQRRAAGPKDYPATPIL